jgi:hypothetical protein
MTLPVEDRVAPPLGGAIGLPSDVDPLPADGSGELDERSLLEDVQALIDDGKTYLEAELTFQKTRAAFVADGAKGTVAFAGAAALLGLMALFGLTVGLIIALSPLITAWGATGVVVGLLLLGALLAARAASRKWSRMMSVLGSGPTS